MTYFRPCANCPHKTIDGKPCPIKAEKLAIVRAAKLTLANFGCEKRLSELPPGQRVELNMTLIYDCEGGRYSDEPETKDFTGTVMRELKNGRVLVWLDEESPQGKNPLPLKPDGMRPIEGELLVRICPECGQPEGTKGREWDCSRPGCLNMGNIGSAAKRRALEMI